MNERVQNRVQVNDSAWTSRPTTTRHLSATQLGRAGQLHHVILARRQRPLPELSCFPYKPIPEMLLHSLYIVHLVHQHLASSSYTARTIFHKDFHKYSIDIVFCISRLISF